MQLTHKQRQKSLCVMVEDRERFDQQTNEISQRSVSVCICVCVFDTHSHSHILILRQSKAPLSFLLPLLVWCAILHHWCGELVLCYCCLPPSFPIPESSSTWLSTQLQQRRPSTPPLARCVYVFDWLCRWLEGGAFCECLIIALVFTSVSFLFLCSSIVYLYICSVLQVCVWTMDTCVICLGYFVFVSEASRWQACLKYSGQTILRAWGFSFSDS